jgi:hypothetical protein
MLILFGKLWIALALAMLLSSVIAVVEAQAGEVTLKPTDDTYVNSYNQNSNFGGETSLDILHENIYYEGQNHIVEDVMFLKFNLSSVPNGAVIDLATLQLYPRAHFTD